MSGVTRLSAAALFIAASAVAPAAAQDGGTPASASPQPAAAVAQERAGETMAFDVPAQPLSGALTAFGRQSGLQVSVDHGTLAGLATNGVQGRMTAEQALRRILSGTGVIWRFTDDKSVVLTKSDTGAMSLDPIMKSAPKWILGALR